LTLDNSVNGLIRLDDFFSHPYVYARGYERNLEKSTISQTLRRLRDKGFVEKIEDKEVGKIVFKLTDLGREFLLISRDDKEIDWDGKWRIVIFDIPESKRLVRDVLRRKLKTWGFVPWQKSVWASKKNLTNRLRQMVEELKIENWVLILESENIGR